MATQHVPACRDYSGTSLQTQSFSRKTNRFNGLGPTGCAFTQPSPVPESCFLSVRRELQVEPV
jgi:hypothetical protein